jgi:transcriptional regulator
MYLPPAFREEKLEALHGLIRTCPLGTLITTTAGGVVANHAPFTLYPEEGSAGFGLLRAHLARGNDQARPHGSTADALVIFLGVDHYITPSWYETKIRTGKVVPTWNYIAVHASGPMRVIDDPIWVRRQIEDLTTQHEGGRARPWAVSDAPAEFIASQLRAIVGIEIDLRDLKGKWKLSQNRTAEDRKGVADGLAQEPDAAGPAMAPLIAQGD